jgi:hypothetical protein
MKRNQAKIIPKKKIVINDEPQSELKDNKEVPPVKIAKGILTDVSLLPSNQEEFNNPDLGAKTNINNEAKDDINKQFRIDMLNVTNIAIDKQTIEHEHNVNVYKEFLSKTENKIRMTKIVDIFIVITMLVNIWYIYEWSNQLITLWSLVCLFILCLTQYHYNNILQRSKYKTEMYIQNLNHEIENGILHKINNNLLIENYK